MKRPAAVLLLLVSMSILLPAQAMPPAEPLMPEEYDPEEFPMWAHDLRRYEVIAIGSYPVTFFATSLIYDFSVYAANDFDPAYSMGTQRDSRDLAIIIGTAAAVSLIIATVDLAINVNKRKKAEEASREP